VHRKCATLVSNIPIHRAPPSGDRDGEQKSMKQSACGLCELSQRGEAEK